MSNILISTESRFPINRKLLKQAVENFLAEQKINLDIEVSISIVGDRKMRNLNKQYRQHDNTTPVLTFSQTEGQPLVSTPDNILRLGDIIISYPQAILTATEENKMVDQVLSEFVTHGLKNLLGLSS